MFAAVQAVQAARSAWELVAIDAGAVVAVCTAVLTLSKIPPLRWLIGRLFTVFSEPVQEMVERPTRELADQLIPRLDDLSTALEEHRRYTYYHLGPNSNSPALHTRLEALESEIVNHS